jgi:multidrug efflux pump subunit AcrA (membrane-fusion protein)
MAPQVEKALDAYVDESHTKAIAILPLKEPRDEEARFTSEEDHDPAQVIGALIVEQMVDSRTPEGFLQRVEVVRTHSAMALTNALEYEGLFLMPLWRFLGRGTRFFRGRALPKTLAILGALAGLIAFLCLYQREFKLEGDGKLRPVIRQNVWAEIDGDVRQVHVEHNVQVEKGQVLVEQHSDELETKIKDTQGQLDTAIVQKRSLDRQLKYKRDETEADRSQQISELTQLETKIEYLTGLLELLGEQRELLKIRSPIAGRIVTWNVSERLQGRPVNRGENVLEIADPTGDWELEVYMPEYRLGHINHAKAQSQDDLPVTFFLATNPQNQLRGRVAHIDTSAEVRGDSGNTVLVRVTFDQQALRAINKDPKIGATATAKIHCGERAIGYVLFHDLVDFVRKLWFRFA